MHSHHHTLSSFYFCLYSLSSSFIFHLSSFFLAFFSSLVSPCSSLSPSLLYSFYAYLDSSFSTSLLPSPSTSSPLLPAVGSSLSPTPSFAPRISTLLHGLASSLSLSPFIYINEQKSSFHLPPDEQTLLVEEDRRKEERNTEAQFLLVHKFNCTKQGILYKLSLVKGDNSMCFGWLAKGLFHPKHSKHILMLNYRNRAFIPVFTLWNIVNKNLSQHQIHLMLILWP